MMIYDIYIDITEILSCKYSKNIRRCIYIQIKYMIYVYIYIYIYNIHIYIEREKEKTKRNISNIMINIQACKQTNKRASSEAANIHYRSLGQQSVKTHT